MEFKKANFSVNAELLTETDMADYRLHVTQENGELTRISATVKTKGDSPASGNISYNRGAYAIGYFPWDESTVQAVMEDFKTVVESLKTQI